MVISMVLSGNSSQLQSSFQTLIDGILRTASPLQEAIINSSLFDKLDEKTKSKYRRPGSNPKSSSNSKPKLKSKAITKPQQEETTNDLLSKFDSIQYTHWNDQTKQVFDSLNYQLAKEVCTELFSEGFTLHDGSLLSTKITMQVSPCLENSEFAFDPILSIECSPADNQVTFASKVCSELRKLPKYSFLPQVGEWADDPFVLLRYLEFRINDSLLQIDFSLFASLLSLGQFAPNVPINCKVIVHFGPFSSGSPMIPDVSPMSEMCSPAIMSIISTLRRILSLAPPDYRIANVPLNKLVAKLLQNDYCVLGFQFPNVLKALLYSIPELFDSEIRLRCLFCFHFDLPFRKCFGLDAFSAFQSLSIQKNIPIDLEFHQPPV